MSGSVALVLVVSIAVSGSVGDPTPGGFIRFDDIRRDAFSAIVVQRHYGEPSGAPLMVRLSVVGDAADADYSEAARWLAREANVRLVGDPRGVPLYLTERNLIATSGPGAIGATVRSGMAVETIDDRMSPCVVAHEVLHFLGLHHVTDSNNLLHPRCSPNKLESAVLSEGQLGELRRLEAITAVTPAGMHTWASR